MSDMVLLTSVVALVLAATGPLQSQLQGFLINEAAAAAPAVGGLVFMACCFIFFVYFILVNMFLAIIYDSYKNFKALQVDI